MENPNSNNFGFVQPRPLTNSNQTGQFKKNISEVPTSSTNLKHQTSTPCHHDLNNQNTNPNNGSSIHEYFTSPVDGLYASLIGINRTDIGSTNRNTVLSNNININNTTENNSNLSQDVMSYQRVKKIIIDSAQSNEAQLKAKENMLQHLKSIDLSKYSFPNETKPKTDYTYAKTTSYLKECKELANDDIEMPNLCRRARRSPQNSLIGSTSQLNKTETLSPNNQSSTSQIVYDQTQNEMEKSKDKLSFYGKIKSLVFKNNEPNSLNNLSSGSRTLPLERNLNYDYDDQDQFQANKFGLNSQELGTARLITEASSSVTSGPGYISTRSQVYQKNITNIQTQSNGRKNGNLPTEPRSSNKKGIFSCCKLWLLFLILLIPFLIYGLNKLDEKEKIYERLNENVLKKYFNINLNDETIHLIKDEINKSAESIKYFFLVYFPDFIRNKTNLLHEKTSNYINEIIDYKPSNLGGFDLAKNLFKTGATDLVKDLNEIKEKVFTETISNFNNIKNVDIDLIRKELDQKFNYTLQIMSNKLADHMSMYEISKNSYENELKKVKDVLNEMDSRYSKLISQLHEQKKLNEELKSAQTQSVQDQVKEKFSDVSFKQIEEYINRTFYLYNADKTGMTDFASESVGGSIMFTRCTENYLDNSKWFTVFDVPITRITVSPRVVIQGSIQPGNCWAFKGFKADLFIKLAARITPTSFSLEHIPKELSLTGNIDSAPQNFTVYGYVNKDDISDDNRLLLGNYRYDNESKNTLQFFSVQHHYLDKPISVIELKIESNAGNKDYTCLYKFRVHGKLFKTTQEENKKLEEESKNIVNKVELGDEEKPVNDGLNQNN